MEVTTNHELVWEYISPYYGMDGRSNHVYRAYRVPYEWVPQLAEPFEKAVPKVDNRKFRVPGTEWKEDQGVIKVEGTLGFAAMPQLCVADTDD